MSDHAETAQREVNSNVLFVYDGEFSHDNGVSAYIRTIGNYLTREDCQVEYLVGKASTAEPRVNAFSRTASVHANGSHSFFPVHTPTVPLTETLSRIKPDAVHVQMPFLPTMAGKVIKHVKDDVALIGTFHTPTPTGLLLAANKLNARLVKSEMHRFNAFFSVSEVAQQAARDIYDVDSEILPCPIDMRSANVASDPNEDGDKVIITFLGRLVARKGLGDLLRSFDHLDVATKKRVRLQIIGDGEERMASERQVDEMGLTNRTHFHGQVSDNRKFELLAGSDIVVYPSSGGESFGIVLAEAMATAKPVVLANNINGYSEVLKAAPESLLDTSDPRALAQSIKQVILDETRRKNMFALQQKIVKSFDVTHTVGPRLMQAYGFTPKYKQEVRV